MYELISSQIFSFFSLPYADAELRTVVSLLLALVLAFFEEEPGVTALEGSTAALHNNFLFFELD